MDKQLQISFAEAKYVLKHLTKEEKEKIPAKLRRFITDNSAKGHDVDINKLDKRTYALLAVIYRKYLAKNKDELEKEHQERLKKENIVKTTKMKSAGSGNKS
ncbi:MAG: hypothetical protein IJW36_03715 [Clostridia bacterium]|nr:hypothetical protein [Clostridia bacterium]